MTSRGRAFLVAALLAVTIPAQAGTRAEPTVAVLGASVSAGFVDFITDGVTERNRSFRLAVACRALWPPERAQVRDYSELALFKDPVAHATPKVERALRAEPDLVVAIDFMFWFGYGHVAVRAREGETPEQAEARQRLELQGRGIELLERFRCPIVLGDYPDMRGADPRMLSARQIPSPAVLQQLNERLRSWVEGRDNVQLFRLAEWVALVKDEKATLDWRGRSVALPSDLLLQTDRLHATRLGVALLTSRLIAAVERALPEGHALRQDLPATVELFERLGVDVEVPAPEPAGTGGAARSAPVERKSG